MQTHGIDKAYYVEAEGEVGVEIEIEVETEVEIIKEVTSIIIDIMKIINIKEAKKGEETILMIMLVIIAIEVISQEIIERVNMKICLIKI